MAITSNGYGEGLNKDITKSKYKPSQYIDAQNIRVTTKDGLSTFSVNNIKGTKQVLADISQFGHTFPAMKPSYYLSLADVTSTQTTQISITIGAGTTSSTFTVTTTTTIKDLYDFLVGYPGYGTEFNVAVTDKVVIYSVSIDTNVQSTNQNAVKSGFNSYGGAIETPIGYGIIRDSIIVFTTSDDSATGGQGSIWKLTYDDTIQPFNYTLKLLYSNLNIGFTTRHPIINEAKGNYENIDVQKIYWTDNFNNIRYVNTENPNLFAVDPNDLSITPSASLSVPKLYSINDNDGSLNEQYVYQCFYRLKTLSGSSSNYSQGSTYVSIINQPESKMNTALGNVPTREYYGGSAPTVINKSITFEINDIDLAYDFIEVVAVNIFTNNAVNFYTGGITSDSVFCTFRSETDGILIDVADITTYNSIIDRAKSIEIKDQRLLAANVTESKFLIDFDTRAYRFPASTLDFGAGFTYNGETINYNLPTSPNKWDGTILKNGSGSFITVNSSNYNLSDTADAINPIQSPNSLGTVSSPNFKFQADGKTVGGQGPNVSYKFITEELQGDAFTSYTTDLSFPGKDWRRVDSTGLASSSFVYNNQTYNIPAGSTYSFIDNYHSELYKSYQHEEVYRFGIVFIDNTGKRSVVSWIADILMPSWYEITPLGTDDYAITKYDPLDPDRLNYKCLGIEFTLSNTNQLPKNITHYQIVRVKRAEADKTVLFGGLMFYSELDTSSTCTGMTEIWQQSDNYSSPIPTPDKFFSIAALDNWLKYKRDGAGYTFKTGDYITTPGGLDVVNTQTFTIPTATSSRDYTLEKAYSTNSADAYYGSLSLLPINNAANSTDTFSTICGYVAPATTYAYRPTTVNTFDSLGNQVFADVNYTKLIYNPGWTTVRPAVSSDYLYAYYHTVLPNQYGGNSYLNRSNSEYISTYNYNKITSTTTRVLGGDMYYYINDYYRFKLKGEQTPPVSPGDPWGDDVIRIVYFPVETYYNEEWQANLNTVNRAGVLNVTTPFDTYNHVIPQYRTNEIEQLLKFYPLPITTTSTSTVHDNRIYASELKYNGEAGESWGIFKANNFRDVDSIYGPINKLIAWKDNVYFFQDRAYGIIPVNVRSLVQDTSGTALQLGTGDVITKQGYVSFDTGTKHQFSVVAADSGIYFYDVLGKNLMLHKGQPIELSEAQGLDAYFPENLTGRILVSDNTIWGPNTYNNLPAGIVGVFDYRFNQVIYTFKDVQFIKNKWEAKNFTVAYNDLLNCFESFYSFDPNMYISDRNNVFSVYEGDIHLHNYGNYGQFYGLTYPSSIKFITNPNPNLTKIFDNIAIQSEVYDSSGINIGETIDKIRCTTDYQDSGVVNLISPSTIRRRERTWTLDVPRDLANAAYTSVSKPRLRDKYMTTELIFTNNNNKKLVLHDTVTAFRESPAGYPTL